MKSIVTICNMLRGLSVAFCLAIALIPASPALGQGVQTGTLAGVTTSSDGQPLPGVRIEAMSPSHQGVLSAVSDENGVYILRGLAPGTYRMTFEIPSFRSAAREDIAVTSGGTARVDATLSLAAVAENVTVTAAAPSVVIVPGMRQTYSKAQIDTLPVGRRPLDILDLAPGVTMNAFSALQATLAGSWGYDNVFMVNGVDVNDNINGTANNLFIEDAVEETTVLLHGVPAEYGRFSGGVINIVTRSGGNMFGGSFR